ncbi:subtilase family serine protease [Paraburkholderia sp. JPY419]
MQDSHVNVPGSCKSHNTNSASKLCHARLSELIRLDYIIVNGQETKLPIGGTSLASPIFVGGWARLESAKNNSLSLPTPAFYENLPGNTALCHDVTSGNNGYDGYGFTAKPGWGMVTGFGSLDFAKVSAAMPSWRAQ